ncbi:MAG TPA: ChbG/HpnK family deacetylase [Thermoflexia bacterium]|jgi:predicted glycoside hydrolase/deacetylase ChbG (UPF0249 family)|nr:ChbG/HpnK family deacetylase [Thermoflexia bacterium]
MTRRLIIHADDLGFPAGTVEAIGELFEAGIVTSTSAMVNQPDWPRAAALLRDHPEWDAGVHLVMNDGRPILPPEKVPSLVDSEGRFRDGIALLARYPVTSLSELKAEWKAQIERFIADVGRPPSHLDLHCHYPYVFPSWFRLSVELAEEYGGLAVRTPFDDALEEKAKELSARYGGFPPWFIRWQGLRYRRMVDQKGLPRTNYWESAFSQDGARTVEVLLEILDNLPEGSTELLCHPGTEGWRREDYETLKDPRVRKRIEERGIRLIGYVDLLAHPQRAG